MQFAQNSKAANEKRKKKSPALSEQPRRDAVPRFKTFNAKFAVSRARQIANEEANRTRKLAPGAGHNDVYDAERHARWTYRMSQELGWRWADLLSAGHEFEDEARYLQRSNEYFMDSHNNSVGIDAARQGLPIPDRHNPNLIYMRSGDMEYYAH